MGRGGNEIAAEQLLYGKAPLPLRGRSESAALIETIIDQDLLADGRIDFVASSGQSAVFNVLNGEGRRLFLYRPAPKGIDQQLFLPQCHVYPEPTGAVMHEQLGDSRDMLAWREEGGQWIVSANTINGEYMASNSTNVADRDVELTTIRGYPRMAWIELRGHGENGFVLVESDKNEPRFPARAVSSYPTAVHGEPGNVRAIYNSENDEIIAAWSENQAGVAIIRIWSSVSGDSVISLESQLSPDDPRDIEIHEILEREAGPAVVWSPRGKKAFAVAGTGGRTSELFTGGVQPQFDVLEDDRLVFAHQWGGDLMIGEVPDHGWATMTATVPGVEEAQIFGGERIRAVYRASGKNPGIFQLEEDGSSRAIPGTRQAHILSAGKDSRGQDVAWLLDHSGSKPEIRKLAVR